MTRMMEWDLVSFSMFLITVFYLVLVPSAVVGWFICRRFVATGETEARIETEPNARRSRTSSPLSMIVGDQVSRDGRDAQANQRQMRSIANSVEVPRLVVHEDVKTSNKP